MRSANRLARWGAMLWLVSAAGYAGTVSLTATGPGSFRWLDIADWLYGTTFQSTYDYEADATDPEPTVTFTYADVDSSFHGTLVATGLKPNFAYQIKLEGIPNLPWETSVVAADNEALGYAGRWWVDVYDIKDTAQPIAAKGHNAGDGEYEGLRSAGFTDGEYWYVFKGYLLFDYVVTDPDGTTPGTAGYGTVADSSFHVLWRTTQRPPAANDSLPTTHTVHATRTYYDVIRRDRKVSLYGEWEQTRALPGSLLLPVRAYRGWLMLTEESFHATTTAGGYWAKALAGYVEFEITDDAAVLPPDPGVISGVVVNQVTRKPIAGAKVTADSDSGSPFSAFTDRKGKYTLPDLVPGDYTVTASATGYVSQNATVTVPSGATVSVSFGLTLAK